MLNRIKYFVVCFFLKKSTFNFYPNFETINFKIYMFLFILHGETDHESFNSIIKNMIFFLSYLVFS